MQFVKRSLWVLRSTRFQPTWIMWRNKLCPMLVVDPTASWKIASLPRSQMVPFVRKGCIQHMKRQKTNRVLVKFFPIDWSINGRCGVPTTESGCKTPSVAALSDSNDYLNCFQNLEYWWFLFDPQWLDESAPGFNCYVLEEIRWNLFSLSSWPRHHMKWVPRTVNRFSSNVPTML